MTSTTPTPQAAEEVQDEVHAKSTEPSLEKECRIEPTPQTEEVVTVAEVVNHFNFLI